MFIITATIINAVIYMSLAKYITSELCKMLMKGHGSLNFKNCIVFCNFERKT